MTAGVVSLGLRSRIYVRKSAQAKASTTGTWSMATMSLSELAPAFNQDLVRHG